MQAKLRVLKQYVFELKESYDELLRAFSQLELAAKDKIAVLENRLLAALNTAKVDQKLTLPSLPHFTSSVSFSVGVSEACTGVGGTAEWYAWACE